MENKSAVVLLSGGQDSTTCLFWALRRYEKVVALGFNYGQKHAVELQQAKKITELAGVEYHVLDVRGVLPESALTNHAKDINAPHDNNVNLPSSFTAGRNALFFTLAASWAYTNHFEVLVSGVCQTDYSGYPDCRQRFVVAMERALRLAMDFEVLRIETPLMFLTKAQTWRMAAELRGEYQVNGNATEIDVVKIVKEMTMTDYNGDMTMNEFGMGKEDNPATMIRARGYREAVEKNWI